MSRGSNAKVERLLTLFKVLLDARHPLTAQEIRAQVPGYGAGDEAFRRTFERDKVELGEMLGQPVRAERVPGTNPPADGYRLRPTDAYLRDPGLTPEERRALAVAASAVRLTGVDPHRGPLKLGAAVPDAGGATGGAAAELPAGPDVVALFQAVAERRVARFRYRDEERAVHPLRIQFTKGRWYLTAFDTGRGAERQFRLDRVAGAVTVGPPGAFVPTAPVAPGRLDEPWALGHGPEVVVRVRIDAARADAARRAAPSASVAEEADGSIVLALATRNPEALRSFVLGFVDGAEVLSPPEVRADVVAWLEAVLAAAGGPDGVGAEGGTATGVPGPDGGPGGAGRGAAADVPGLAGGSGDAGGGLPGPDGGPGAAGGPGPGSAAPPPVPPAGGEVPDRAERRETAGDRMHRVLAELLWIAEADGPAVAEAAARFGVDEAQVLADLELACMIGSDSDDYLDMPVEMYMEGDRVFVHLHAFDRPLRLTPAEALSLVVAGSALAGGLVRSGALARALEKVADVLGIRLGEQVEVDLGVGDPVVFAAVRRAVDEQRAVEIDYLGAERESRTHRVVEPWALFRDRGAWYLTGHCRRAGAERIFRSDRILAARVLAEAVSRPPVLPPLAALRTPVDAPRLVVDLDEEARWVVDSHPVERVEAGPGGRLRVTLVVVSRPWLERLLLRLGPSARVVGGDPALGAARPATAAARRALARYRAGLASPP